MKISPFKPGVIDPDKKTFFGRKKEIEILQKNIQNSNVILIWGPRRMGKSWFIKHFLHVALLPEYLPVLIDFRDLNSKSGKTIFEQISVLIYNSLAYNLSGKDASDKILNQTSIGNLNSFEQFNSYFNQIRSFFENRKIIIAIDEFDEIDKFVKKGEIDEFFISNLCSWSEKIPNFNLILIGGVYLDEIRKDEIYGALAKFPLIPITLLNKEQSVKWIVDLFKESDILVNEEIANKIYFYTGGQPQLLQQISDILFDKLCQENKTEASIDDLEYVIRGELDNITLGGIKIEDWTHSYFNIAWESIKGNKTLLNINPKNIILSSLANLLFNNSQILISDIKNHLEKNNIKIVDLEKQIEKLVRYSILLEYEKLKYSFSIELFRLWIIKNYPFEIEKIKIAEDGKLKQIEKELIDYFSPEYWNLLPPIIQDQIISYEVDFLKLDNKKNGALGKFYLLLIETLLKDLIFSKIRDINNRVIFNKNVFISNIRLSQTTGFFNNRTNKLTLGESSTIILNNLYLKEFISEIKFLEDRDYFTNDRGLENYFPPTIVNQLYNNEFIENVRAEYWGKLFDSVNNSIWDESFQNVTYIFRIIRNWVMHDAKNILNTKSINIIHQVLFYSTIGPKEGGIIRKGKYIKRILHLSKKIDELKEKGMMLNVILKNMPYEGIRFTELYNSLSKDPGFEEIKEKLRFRITKNLEIEEVTREFLRENLDYLTAKKAAIIKKTKEGELYSKQYIL